MADDLIIPSNTGASVSPIWTDVQNVPKLSAVPPGFVRAQVIGLRVDLNANGLALVYQTGDFLVLPRAQATHLVQQQQIELV